jgi:glycine dehydrogenase
MSFPIPGTLMIEPTESEPRAELDRFCEAMVAIRGEIAEIERGRAPREGNVLTSAPHTAAALLTVQWTHPYPREKADVAPALLMATLPRFCIAPRSRYPERSPRN